MLSDFWPHGDVALKYGVLRSEGRSERALFIIDDNGFIRYIDVHDIDDQPDNKVLFTEIKKLRPGYVEEVIDPAEIKVTPWRHCYVLHKMVPRLPPCPPLVERKRLEIY